MHSVQNQIVEKMKSLVYPPEGIPATGGVQLKDGNRYPDTEKIDLDKHVRGEATYALETVYTDASGTESCKWGVIDIDESGPEGLQKARAVTNHLAGHGIASTISFSGRKGFHVYVHCEPVPKEVMVKFLQTIKGVLPFEGEIIPGDAQRCKPAPCLHQVSGHMSYLLADQNVPEQFGLDSLPDCFYEDQLAILNGIVPTPANIIIKAAMADPKPQGQPDSKDLIPDLSAQDEYIPPCISRLIENGGSAKIGTYDKNNLTLATFCTTKNLSAAKRYQMAETLARNSQNGPVVTTKDHADKLKHFNSIQESPSVRDKPFNCALMLRAKKELAIDCGQCKVRPQGIRTGSSNETQAGSSPLLLEKSITRDLMAYIIQKGAPVEYIAAEVLPKTEYSSKLFSRKTVTGPAYGILMQNIHDGNLSAVKIAQWIDTTLKTEKDLGDQIEIEGKTPAECLKKHDVSFAAFHYEFKNAVLHLYDQLSNRPIVDEDTFEHMLQRAVELTLRYQIALQSTTLGKESCDKAKDIHTLHSDFIHSTTQVMAGSQKGAIKPLSERQQALIGYILGGGFGTTPTPLPELNTLLGGGLINGCLYMLVSPPGGGKSTLAAQAADHAAGLGIPVIFISMEMGIEQLFVNSMARAGCINSAKIMSPYAGIKDAVLDQVGETAEIYFEAVATHLYVVEGSYDTTPSKIASMVSMVRANHGLTKDAPLLVVIDYLQLLNTGKELLDTSPNETLKISELAVRCKQLARDSNVAVLAISDITKDEQQKNYNSKEFTLNSLRGSNRIAHAADTVIALYSESSEADGGKAKQDPWDIYVEKVSSSENAQDFVESVSKAKDENGIGGDGATVYARLELIKNRAGQGRGSQFLLYHRAYHKFEPVELNGQAKAEGRA